jgi:hypothetical protein
MPRNLRAHGLFSRCFDGPPPRTQCLITYVKEPKTHTHTHTRARALFKWCSKLHRNSSFRNRQVPSILDVRTTPVSKFWTSHIMCSYVYGTSARQSVTCLAPMSHLQLLIPNQKMTPISCTRYLCIQREQCRTVQHIRATHLASQQSLPAQISLVRSIVTTGSRKLNALHWDNGAFTARYELHL